MVAEKIQANVFHCMNNKTKANRGKQLILKNKSQIVDSYWPLLLLLILTLEGFQPKMDAHRVFAEKLDSD